MKFILASKKILSEPYLETARLPRVYDCDNWKLRTKTPLADLQHVYGVRHHAAQGALQRLLRR